MPITPYLDGHQFDSETKRIMGIAFELTRAALHLEDRTDRIVAIIANRIIELAKGGERDANVLSERVTSEFEPLPSNLAQALLAIGVFHSRRRQWTEASGLPRNYQVSAGIISAREQNMDQLALFARRLYR
jgi:hypothetical protein